MAEKNRISSTETTMDEQWLKTNTDCVYFLASPLTCKKGIECEFRHSEIARLNPRECRYWFSKNCLNPNCAFRHPPLDGPNDASMEPAHMYQQIAAPVSKLNVPCYFFFNGFCNKGQSCSFLHELDNANQGSTEIVHAINMPVGGDISSSAPIVTRGNPYAIINKPATDNTIAMGNYISLIPPIKTCADSSAFTRPIIDKKIPMASDLQSASSIITHASPLESYPDVELSEKNNSSTLQDVSRHFPNQQSSEPLFKEDKISKLNFPLPSRELTKKTSEQSSDDQVGSCTEQEERESSPSFDVQVNEHDADKFPCKFDKVNGGYPYENVDLNFLYPDVSIMYGNEDYQSCDHFVIENPSSPGHVKNRELDFLHSQRWTSLRSRRASGNEDLRDRLKKRRLMNGNYQDCRSSQNEERHRNPILKQSRGRLASQVVITDLRSHIERRDFNKSSTQRRIPWLSRRSKSGQHFRARRSDSNQPLNSRKSKPQEKFSERREMSGGAGEEEFRGPKSLDEILKEKKMLRSEESVIVN